MIDYLKTPAIMLIVFALIINAILYIKNMKKIGGLICLIFSFIIPAALIVLKALNISLPNVGSFTIEIICAVVSAIIIIINVILSFGNASNDNELYYAAPGALDRKILGYLDGEGKLIQLTPYFYDAINIFDKEKKNWFNHIQKIYYNSQQVNYDHLVEELKDNDGTEAKLTILLNNNDGFDDEVSFNFLKVNVDVDDETIGYVLVEITPQVRNLTDGFSFIMDDVDFPYAYYNDDSRSVIFKTNKTFKNLLGVKGYNVTYSELRRLVYPEDLQSFDRAASTLAADGEYYYRMKTSLGLKKFKEVISTKENHVTAIIQIVNDVNNKLLDKRIVFAAVDSLLKEKKNFGGLIVSLNNFVDLFNGRGPIVAKELANRYVEYIRSEILGKDDYICKISDIEYVMLFSDIDKFDLLIRDIKNKVSTIAHYEFNYGDETIETTNSIGIVYSNENIKSSNDFMNALDNALALANSNNLSDGVNIFIPSEKKEVTNTKLNKENYSFDKIKISLDNSFLDDDEI